MSQTQLIILAKNPIKGKVKTRLAVDIGEEKALEVYKFLLAHTFRVVASSGLETHVFFSNFIDQSLLGYHSTFKSYIQQGDGLGERLKHAFQAIQKPGKNVVVIGSDCFQLSSKQLLASVDALSVGDMVIGPSHDGGYYLLGLKEYDDFIFNDIPWSTEKVFKVTMEKAKIAGLKVVQLETLYDVDDIDSLHKCGLVVN